MSHAEVSTTVDPSSLIGSQLETYHTLIAMGFAPSQSLNVAQIFGSNAEGAIECLLNSDDGDYTLPDLNSPFSPRAADTDDRATDDIQPESPFLSQWVKPVIDDEIIEFRTTSLSHMLMAGYIRNEQIHYQIPTVINDLIIRYFNLYFVKLNYNIHNDPLPIHEAIETDEKYSDWRRQNEDDSDDLSDNDPLSDDCITDEEIQCPFTMNVYVVKSDITLREMAITLEKSYKYQYENIMNSSEYFNCKQYQYFVHLWINFRFIKQIYPLDNKHMKIHMDDIDAYEHDHDYDANRWVEIPNDFEEIKVSEIDTVFAASADDKHSVLELGIETFDQISKQWPFRNKMMVPLPHEIYKLAKKPKEKSPTFMPLDLLKSLKMHNYKGTAAQNEAAVAWQCAFCGRENDKTYVFCAGCFKDKAQEEQNALAPLPGSAPMAAPIAPAPPPTIPSNDHQHNLLEADHVTLPAAALEAISARSRSLSPVPEKKIVPNPACLEWTKHLKIGDIVDVKDEQDKWYESVIRFIESNGEKKLLYLHYIGWNKKWDEALSAQDINRIAKRNSHTIGPHRPKRTQYSTKPRSAYPYFLSTLAGNV